jgi:hypothetical protein
VPRNYTYGFGGIAETGMVPVDLPQTEIKPCCTKQSRARSPRSAAKAAAVAAAIPAVAVGRHSDRHVEGITGTTEGSLDPRSLRSSLQFASWAAGATRRHHHLVAFSRPAPGRAVSQPYRCYPDAAVRGPAFPGPQPSRRGMTPHAGPICRAMNPMTQFLSARLRPSRKNRHTSPRLRNERR